LKQVLRKPHTHVSEHNVGQNHSIDTGINPLSVCQGSNSWKQSQLIKILLIKEIRADRIQRMLATIQVQNI
jgi:hypothetical protein